MQGISCCCRKPEPDTPSEHRTPDIPEGITSSSSTRRSWSLRNQPQSGVRIPGLQVQFSLFTSLREKVRLSDRRTTNAGKTRPQSVALAHCTAVVEEGDSSPLAATLGHLEAVAAFSVGGLARAEPRHCEGYQLMKVLKVVDDAEHVSEEKPERRGGQRAGARA